MRRSRIALRTIRTTASFGCTASRASHRVRTTRGAPTSNDAYLRLNPFRTVDRRDSQQGKPCHSSHTSSRRQRVSDSRRCHSRKPSAGDVTVGGGMRTSFSGHRFRSSGEGGSSDSSSDFALNSARLYVSGTVDRATSSSCSTPSTTAATNAVGVLDAVAQFDVLAASSTSGSAASCRRAIAPTSTARTTPTTGRVYTDGVQDGYPFVFQGRDNGVDVLGPVRQGEGLGRRVRRPVGDRRRRRCSAPAACRSTSGIRKPATT